MTNFDVIEAYIEDFTKWVYRNSRGTALALFNGGFGNGKIRIGLPGINKDIVLDANDIETFKQSLVK